MPLYTPPIKSSVHRYACLALYRALVRATRLETVSQDARTTLQAAIKQRFRKNRLLQQPLELRSALLLGYHALQVLRSPQSDASKQAIGKLAAKAKRLCPIPSRKDDSSQPQTKAEIKLRAEKGLSNEPVVWKRSNTLPIGQRPLPLEKLSGRIRQVPRYAVATGIAFLRLTKPQPPLVSRMLRQKIKQFLNTFKLEEKIQETHWLHPQEDKWDALLAQRHGLQSTDDVKWVKYATDSSKALSLIRKRLNEKREKHNKRVRRIYEQERELAAKERQERIQKRQDDLAARQRQKQQGEARER